MSIVRLMQNLSGQNMGTYYFREVYGPPRASCSDGDHCPAGHHLVPYQRRAQHAGQCGVEVEGGRVPTADWFLNLQILTSGGFR